MGKFRFSGYASSETPRPIFKKNWHSWLRRGPHHTRKFWGQSVQRGRVCACVKLSPSGVYFFSLFSRFHAPHYRSPCWTDRCRLTAQMTRPGGHYILFMVSLIRKIFFLFLSQKCEKLHYTLWELWTAITLASLKMHTSCLHQTGGFRGHTIEWCYSNLPQNDPCCHGKQS